MGAFWSALERAGLEIPGVTARSVNFTCPAWLKGTGDTATEAAGYPAKLLHDFRRTAVRNLERAGVPRSSAMKMVGHATESIYRRYAIQDETMLREASEKLEAWTEGQAKGKAKPKGQVRRMHKARGESKNR